MARVAFLKRAFHSQRQPQQMIFHCRLEVFELTRYTTECCCATNPRGPSNTTAVVEPSTCQVRSKQLPFKAKSWRGVRENAPGRSVCCVLLLYEVPGM